MKDRFIKGAAVLAILAGVVLVFWQPVNSYIISPYVVGQAQDDAMSLSQDDYAQNRETMEREIETDEGMFDYDSVESLDSLSVNVDIDDERAIGEIMIPSVDVHLPILMGTNDETLKAGIGTMKPDQEMGAGNYALAGHNSSNPEQLFAPIRNIDEGDEILLTDKDRVYVYEKISSEVVMPEKTEVIDDQDGKELVTLVSCYSDDGSDRLIVKGELTEELAYEEVEHALTE